MGISQTIQAYYREAGGEHHRYRSWEHCFSYFMRIRNHGLAADRDHAALQLAFYLASWGMYRGSSFLLQHAYTVHWNIIDLISSERFDSLWGVDFGARDTDKRLIPVILELIEGIREGYKEFVKDTDSGQPTDTLITKIILGIFGCLPACDRYFIDGFKSEQNKFSDVNGRFIDRILAFCQTNLPDLQKEQAIIEQVGGIRYPLMKLVDMYFWQIGYEKDRKTRAAE